MWFYFLNAKCDQEQEPIFKDIRHWSSWGHKAWVGFNTSLIMSELEEMCNSSALRSQQLECQIALATEHLKKRWQLDSISQPHSTQDGSSMPILWSRFSFVGMVLVPKLQWNILVRSGALNFHSLFQLTSKWGGGWLHSLSFHSLDGCI